MQDIANLLCCELGLASQRTRRGYDAAPLLVEDQGGLQRSAREWGAQHAVGQGRAELLPLGRVRG